MNEFKKSHWFYNNLSDVTGTETIKYCFSAFLSFVPLFSFIIIIITTSSMYIRYTVYELRIYCSLFLICVVYNCPRIWQHLTVILATTADRCLFALQNYDDDSCQSLVVNNLIKWNYYSFAFCSDFLFVIHSAIL